MRHGWHGTYALNILMKDDQYNKQWRDYTASVLYSIGKMFSSEWGMPAWTDLAYNGNKPKKQQQSKSEIVGGIKAKLREVIERGYVIHR